MIFAVALWLTVLAGFAAWLVVVVGLAVVLLAPAARESRRERREASEVRRRP